jgi:malate dehydrogenase (oxaloacetate-decarboxylating)
MAFDSKGLLTDQCQVTDEHKHELMVSSDQLAKLGLDSIKHPTPEDVIRQFKPTVLIGATATPGTFTQAMIEEMARHTDRPIVMPLSNPTHKAECAPGEAIAWTGGRALVATGSPFADVEHDGQRHVIGQANNVFVFPGVGMGAILSEIHEINEAIFLVAAKTLAESVSDARLKQGALYPDQSELRDASSRITAAIIRYASHNKLGRDIPDDEVEQVVAEASWFPDYVPVVAT